MAKTNKPAAKRGGAKITAPVKKAKVRTKKPSKAARKKAAKPVKARMVEDITDRPVLTFDLATPPKRKWWTRFRSALTGLFVRRKHAEANPATSVGEKVRRRNPPILGRGWSDL